MRIRARPFVYYGTFGSDLELLTPPTRPVTPPTRPEKTLGARPAGLVSQCALGLLSLRRAPTPSPRPAFVDFTEIARKVAFS